MAVQIIDFSCKHDVFILNRDGSLSRMDEPFFESRCIAPDTWQIFSSGDHSYLAAGETAAIAIDTGYGAGNIRAYMQSLTDRPLESVINTHDHFDHTANNGYFERAYMAKETVPLATVPFPSFAGIDFPQDYERIAVEEGHVFDLGGRTLEVFHIPDHAAGSIALLDRRGRILFSGDEINEGGKVLNGGVRSFAANMKKLMDHRSEFDLLAGGPDVVDASVLDALYACALHILEGNEGEPLGDEKFSLPLPKSPDEMGRTVYHRQLPHPEDMHHDGEDPEKARFMRKMCFAGTSITYDLRLKEQ